MGAYTVPGAAAVRSCQTVDVATIFAQRCFYGVKDFMQKEEEKKKRIILHAKRYDNGRIEKGRICVWQSCSVANLYLFLWVFIHFVTSSVHVDYLSCFMGWIRMSFQVFFVTCCVHLWRRVISPDVKGRRV